MINKSLILMNFSDDLYYKCSVWNKAEISDCTASSLQRDHQFLIKTKYYFLSVFLKREISQRGNFIHVYQP